ncbi:hypothetical protein [Catellatospora citrea]|nr:hypothetical protein [Catellatospora citrea]
MADAHEPQPDEGHVPDERTHDAPASTENLRKGSAAKRLYRRLSSPTVFTAVTSVVAALLGALIGGVTTAIATQTTVEAQIEAVNIQLRAERDLQIRASTGQSYEQFLDHMFDLKVTFGELQSCATHSFGTPPLPIGVNIRIDPQRVDEIARCDAAIAAYATGYTAAQKSYNDLYLWGSKSFIADARAVLGLFPVTSPCARNLTSTVSIRSCMFEYPDNGDHLIHMWYQGGLFDIDSLFQAKPMDLAPAVEPNQQDSAGRALAWKAFIARYDKFGNSSFTDQLIGVGLTQLRHDFCREVADAVVDCG